MPDDPRLAARGALLGAACGDALGAPFEGMPPADARDIRAVLEGTSPLRYTDDTAMTIALAESLIEVGGLDESHLAATFARHWRAEPWRGYGRGTFELLRSIAAGAPWVGLAEGQFDGRGSWGNGAAMRVAPVAVLAGADVGRAIDLARRSARVTHAHPLAVDGAVLQTVAITLAMRTAPSRPLRPALFLTRVRAFVREVPLLARLDRVAGLPPDATPTGVAAAIGSGVDALSAVPAAIATALRAGGSMPEAIGYAIALGGDTDTIASMTGAIVGAHLGAEALPQGWVRRLEGADRIVELADRLLTLGAADVNP